MKYNKFMLLLLIGAITLTGCTNKEKINECNNDIIKINKEIEKGDIVLANKGLDELCKIVKDNNIDNEVINNKIKYIKEDISTKNELVIYKDNINNINNLILKGSLDEASKDIIDLESKNISDEKTKQMLEAAKKLLISKQQVTVNKSVEIKQQANKEESKQKEEGKKQEKSKNNNLLNPEQVRKLIRYKYRKYPEHKRWFFSGDKPGHIYYLKQISTGNIYYYTYIGMDQPPLENGNVKFYDILINAKTKEFMSESFFGENMNNFENLYPNDPKPF